MGIKIRVKIRENKEEVWSKSEKKNEVEIKNMYELKMKLKERERRVICK